MEYFDHPAIAGNDAVSLALGSQGFIVFAQCYLLRHNDGLEVLKTLLQILHLTDKAITFDVRFLQGLV